MRFVANTDVAGADLPGAVTASEHRKVWYDGDQHMRIEISDGTGKPPRVTMVPLTRVTSWEPLA